jgi:hypothetical protein
VSQLEILRWDQAYNRNGDGKLPRAVVNVIRTYMNNHTLAGWVSQGTLARDTGLDESNVRRQIRKNADAGWLVVTKRGRAGRASEYRLTYPQPGADARLNTDDADTATVQIRTVRHPGPNRAQMPGYSLQPGADARLLPGADARPTASGTSPQEKFHVAVEGSEAPNNGADGRGRGGPSLGVAFQPATASRPAPWSDDPFADEGERHHAREEPAYAGDDWSHYGDRDTDMSAKAQRIRAHRPFWVD